MSGKDNLRKNLVNVNPRSQLFLQSKLGLTNEVEEEKHETIKHSEPAPEVVPIPKTTATSVTEEGPLPRRTYYLTEELIEAITILCYRTRSDISATVRDLLEKAMPEDVMQEARENIQKNRK